MTNVEEGQSFRRIEGPRIYEAAYNCSPPPGTKLPNSSKDHPTHVFKETVEAVRSDMFIPERELPPDYECPLDPNIRGKRMSYPDDLGSPTDVDLPPRSNTRYWLGIKPE